MKNYNIPNQLYTMQTDNKQISIFPLLNKDNSLSQEPIYDAYGNFIKYLSNFRYIENNNETNQFKSFNILVDLDINLYNNDINYRNAIYSKLLSYNRIDKIYNEYHNYAGGLSFNPATNKYEKYVDKRILDSLNYKQKLKNQDRLSSFQNKRRDFLSRVQSYGVHIKTDHAQKLTPEMYKEMYGKSLYQDER